MDKNVTCIIECNNNTYMVYDTKKNIELAFGSVKFIEFTSNDGLTIYGVTVNTIPTERVQIMGVNQLMDVNQPMIPSKLHLFRIETNNVDYRKIIADVTQISNKLNIQINNIAEIIAKIITRDDKEKWPKGGGKKRYRSSRKSSSSRRRRSTKRRTTSRKQQKRRRSSRRAH